MASKDPYYVVRDDVQQAVNGVSNLFAGWQTLLRTTDTANDEEFIWTTNELKSGVRSIEWDLQDLEETVSIVEANPKKFSLSADELNERKRFISQTKAKMSEIKQALVSTDTKSKQAADQRKNLMKTAKSKQPTNKFSKLESAIDKDNSNFLNDQQQQQQLIMQDQDQDLTDLQHTVGNLGEIGLTINDELETHNRMLNELNAEVDDTSAQMKRAMKKVNRILQDTADKKPWCVIAILSIILIALIVLVFNV